MQKLLKYVKIVFIKIHQTSHKCSENLQLFFTIRINQLEQPLSAMKQMYKQPFDTTASVLSQQSLGMK